MALICTRCEGTGFLNLDQVDDSVLRAFDDEGNGQIIIAWMLNHDDDDVEICDCCGDGCGWHGVRGEHYNHTDPQGDQGPYHYNGGLCECH